MQWRLRPAEPADGSWLLATHKAAMREHAERAWGQWDDAVQARLYLERDPRNVVEVIVVDQQDVGVLHTRRNNGAIIVDLIEVLPEHQSKGIGTAVLERVMQKAGEAHCSVELRVHDLNSRARHFYDRIGFIVYDQDATHHMLRWTR